MDDFGPDGTQAPPPPHLFPDSLSGLVTGDADPPRPFPDALSGSAAPGPPVIPQVVAQPVYAEPPRRPAHHKQTRRAPGPTPDLAPAWSNAPRSYSPPQAYQQRSVPYAQRPAMNQVQHQQQLPAKKSGKGNLIGCLVVLATLSGLLFNVLREIVEAVAKLFT
ncbi:hypothetical protein ABZ816_07665 [Actinosynnema sp. NPDC047251]|uniref:hypothetical protein n=1 Tax=Saccharothrix espanaensis TaxID=103731 RepID=UPI0011DC85A6|nr:hypothetical protein [Saccharothrix espanaensis]